MCMRDLPACMSVHSLHAVLMEGLGLQTVSSHVGAGIELRPSGRTVNDLNS